MEFILDKYNNYFLNKLKTFNAKIPIKKKILHNIKLDKIEINNKEYFLYGDKVYEIFLNYSNIYMYKNIGFIKHNSLFIL